MAQPVKPPPKRRRILDPSAIVSVPIYSNQVSNSLQMKAPTFSDRASTEEDADADAEFLSKFSCRRETRRRSPDAMVLSESEEEAEPRGATPPNATDALRSPSPPPPESPVQKPSREAKQKLNELERRLKAVNSLLSSVDDGRRQRRCRRSPRLRDDADDGVIVVGGDDDVIALSPDLTPLGSPLRGPERQIPLKVRCRADLHKIPVLPSTPLSAVVEQLSVKLGVPPPRLLLLREEAELSTDATVGALGLGIADILECMVMAEVQRDSVAGGDVNDVITVRLQGKDRSMCQEFPVRRDAPLGSLFARFSSGVSVVAQRDVSFHFDGCKLSPLQTPQELDMEDGDIIEVWT